MQGTRLKEKVKVFISSNCGGKYLFVRESLRLLLLETNMCEVYMFEQEGATTSDVVSSYMRKLERSDIIVYLIDNKDDIGEGILKEVKRGRELQKKSLFLFCDEEEKEPTELQKEIIGMPNGEKFKVVPRFASMPEVAYESVINDIIDTYLSYCNLKIENESLPCEDNSIENTIEDIRTIIKKESYNNCNYTKWLLHQEVSTEQEYSNEIDIFDKLCGEMFEVILGNKIIDEIDFGGIKRHVKAIHEVGKLQKTILIRLNAMEAYWNGNINEAITLLVKALDIAMGTKKIPRWFVNDIAIDLRNMNVISNQEKNIIQYSTQGQKVLDESEEPVFCPVLDRFSADYYEKISKEMLDNLVDSPFTVKLGGIDYVLDQIVDIFVVALLYGSITHICLIRDKIALYFQSLCFQYRNHKLLVATIKILLLLGNEKNLSNFIEAYGLNTDNISSEDIGEWISSVSKIKIKYRRINALCLLWGMFGLYFNDKQFDDIYAEIKEEISHWVEEQYAGDLISKAYLSALEKNQYRIEQKEILGVANLYHINGLKRWYNDVFGLLSRVQLEKVESIQVKKYIVWLQECVNDEECIRNCRNLPSAIQNIRLQRDDVSALDELVKEKFRRFYDNEYSLNVFEHDLDETNLHIDRLISDIESRNETQGKNGCYSGYATNPYKTIENIIVMSNIKVRVNEIAKVLNATVGTLLSERQTIESKVDAWRLITIIFMMYPNAKCVKKAYEDIIRNIEVCLHGNNILLSNGYNETTLQIAYNFMKVFYNEDNELSVIETFASISKNDTAEIITILNLLYGYLVVAEKNRISITHIKYILQSLLEFSRNKSNDVRFYSYISLIKIMNINKECQNIILSRLSEAMDNEIYKNKVAILSRLSRKKDKKIEYIFTKGKADNHFWVRDIANR